MSQDLQSMGEFGLIRRLQKILKPVRYPREWVGIGDDASVIPLDKKRFLLLTQDLLLEGVHFLKKSSKDFRDVGWKALAVNLSDIAAMGGRPLQAVVGLGIPPGARLAEVEALYRGLRDCARSSRCPILGGDTNASKGGWTVAVTVLGVMDAKPLLRRGARTGETLWVTGELGGAALAWGAYQKRKAFPKSSSFHRRLMRPEPRLQWGELLCKSRWVTSAIDISDGLAGDLTRLGEASRVGFEVEIDRVPRPKDFAPACLRTGLSELETLLSGGEDYELLFTVRKGLQDRFARWAKRNRIKAVCIGRAVRGQKVQFLQDGRPIGKNIKGFQHF